MRSVSVIICTHNPRQAYLAQVLDALRNQTLQLSDWELLIIDNASEAPLDKRFELSWHRTARVIVEKKVGLTHARLRGIREAKGELLVFIDDDNVLDPDYLERAIEISKEYPHLDAWAGGCKGQFEVEPAAHLKRYTRMLCVTEYERDSWCNFPFSNSAMPSGAGLCLRATAAQKYLQLHEDGFRPFVLDRTGKSLLSGGDIDISLTCAESGRGMGVFKRLHLTHLIPKERVQIAYLENLAESMAFSGQFVEFYHPGREYPVRNGLKRKVADALRLMFMTPVERRFFRAQRRGEEAGAAAVAKLRADRFPEARADGACKKS